METWFTKKVQFHLYTSAGLGLINTLWFSTFKDKLVEMYIHRKIFEQLKGAIADFKQNAYLDI